ncbi:uncharacterized protein LOC122925601 [Bufo gargarizans]|uniref:uncharacterized protein LOC122925601 n=1 Tax=Bufo gargarizans TaxID=30331 RepID=UPI001CF2650B|nr:uncharacterized protein LOC122925601 [Bufo gargarizans]
MVACSAAAEPRPTGVTLLCLGTPCLAQLQTFPPGVARTECRERLFWIWLDQTFIGSSIWQLEALNNTGYLDVIHGNRAPQCGYTITKDVYGNMEVRISFLGCWVENKNDRQFDVKVQFRVNQTKIYPVSMSCTPSQSWDVREIVCEENYMEVSVTRIIPAVILNLISLTEPVMGIPQRWKVWFNSSNVPISAVNAIDRGFGVNATMSRVVFRAPYNTSETRVLAIGNLHLDVIASTMLYTQTLLRIIVDTTIACPKDPPVFMDTAFSWLSPAVLSPLISGEVINNMFTVGINGYLLNETEVKTYKYILSYDEQKVNVTIPYGASGGYIESDIVNNTYVTRYSIHLLLKRHWVGIENDDSTTHTSYKPIVAPAVVHNTVFLDHTIKENLYFNVSLGNFYADMDIQSFVIHGAPLNLAELGPRRMTVMTATVSNNTHAFYLTVPFSDPLVEQTYVGGYKRRYRLYVTYILILVPKNKNLTRTYVVDCVIQDAVPPTINGFCEKDRLVINAIRGNMDYDWVPYIRDLPLNDALIASQNITVQNSVTLLHIEVPSTAVGLIYEEVNLENSAVHLDFTLRNPRTLQIQASYKLYCQFPTRPLLCLSNGTMIALIDSTVTKPAFDAQKAHLRDPTCTPQSATSKKALFNFVAYSCGTTSRFDNDYLVYENEVTFDRQVLLPQQPIISRDSSYRLTVRCRYPVRDTLWLSGQYRTEGIKSGLEQTQARVLRRRARTHVAELKLAKDGNLTAFYQNGDFPVSVQSNDVLHFQADVQSPEPMAAIKDCWATTFPVQDGIKWWDLIVDGCGAVAEAFSTEVQTSPDLLPRFKVKIHEAPSSQFFVHCKVIICDGSTQPESCPTTCNQTERLMDKRAVPLPTELVSVGPLQILTHSSGVVYQHVGGETSQSTLSWVLPLGLAVIFAFTVGAIFLTIRLFTQ